MLLMYRLSDCRYRLSMPDPVVEHGDNAYSVAFRDIGRQEAESILRKFGCPETLLKQIMSESTPGFVMG